MAAVVLPSTMHAWQYKEYGKGIHQVELPVPAPGPKELLVKVRERTSASECSELWQMLAMCLPRKSAADLIVQ